MASLSSKQWRVRHVGTPKRLYASIRAMLAELHGCPRRAFADGGFRRWAMRTFCVLRLQQLRREPRYAGENLFTLAKRIELEAREIDPKWRCHVRSLQDWLAGWNAPDAHRMACGLFGLRHPIASKAKRSRRGRGRPSSRSNEAIDFFNRLRIGSPHSSVTRLHRMVLAESELQGWRWPKTVESTRRWLIIERGSNRD